MGSLEVGSERSIWADGGDGERDLPLRAGSAKRKPVWLRADTNRQAWVIELAADFEAGNCYDGRAMLSRSRDDDT